MIWYKLIFTLKRYQCILFYTLACRNCEKLKFTALTDTLSTL